jgi:hypothetical protein
MNAGAFGVLMMLPTRATEYGSHHNGRRGGPRPPVATSAETFEDLAGVGKRHPMLGLAMAVCCFSLIGLPLTVGFFGKVYLIKPALDSRLYWLVIATMVNAAVSAAYYLRIVATMFLRPAPDSEKAPADPSGSSSNWMSPVGLAVMLSVAATLLFGTILPAANRLSDGARQAAQLNSPAVGITAPVTAKQPDPAAAPQTSYNGGWIEDWKLAQGIAAQQKKDILLGFFGTSATANWTSTMDTEVFQTPEFRQYAHDNLVLLKVDFPQNPGEQPAVSKVEQPAVSAVEQPAELKQQNNMLRDLYGVRGYPTIILLNSSGRKIGQTVYQKGGVSAFVSLVESIRKQDRDSHPLPNQNEGAALSSR